MSVARVIVGLIVLLCIGAALWQSWPEQTSETGLTLYGNVDIREVQLGFRVGGRLESMQVDEGDAVDAGELLATLDSKPLQDALALAEARVREAQARLQVLQAGSRPQEVEQARARVREAEAALANAIQEFDRAQEVTKSGLGSDRDLDGAIAQRDQSSARLRANREALALAIEGARVEDIAAAEAGLAAARAQRDLAQTQLDDTRLLAPSSGVIYTRVREPGSIVPVGAPVYTLSLADTVYVRSYIGETQLGRVRPGLLVGIMSDTSDTLYKAQVGHISPRAEFTPKSVETAELRTDLVYRIRILVTEPAPELRQGMPVTVHIEER